MTASQYEHFTVEELSCHCGNCHLGPDDMDTFFMTKLVEVRQYLDFPLPVSSAIRCSAYNQIVSTTGPDGPHTTGKAVDIRVYGNRAFELIEAAYRSGLIKVGCYGGWGVKQHGDHNERFVHIDGLSDKEYAGPRPWIWDYSG